MEHLISLSTSIFRSAGSTREKRLCMQMVNPENPADISAAEKLIKSTTNPEGVTDDGVKHINDIATRLQDQELGTHGQGVLKRILELRQSVASARELKTAREQHQKNLKQIQTLSELATDDATTKVYTDRVHSILQGYLKRINDLSQAAPDARSQNQIEFIRTLTTWIDEVNSAVENDDVDGDFNWRPTYFMDGLPEGQQAFTDGDAEAHKEFLADIAARRKALAEETPGSAEARKIRGEIRGRIEGRITELLSGQNGMPDGVHGIRYLSNRGANGVWNGATAMIRNQLGRIAQLRKELREVDGTAAADTKIEKKEDDKTKKVGETPPGAAKTGPVSPGVAKEGPVEPGGKTGEVKPATPEKPKETNETLLQQILKAVEQILNMLRTNAAVPAATLEGPQKTLNNLYAQRSKLTTELNEITAKITAAGGLPGAVAGNAALIALNTQHASIQKQIEAIDKQIAQQTQLAPLNQQCVKQHCGFLFTIDACGRLICYQSVQAGAPATIPAVTGIMTPFNQFVQQCQPLGCQRQFIGGSQVGCMPPSQLPAVQQMMTMMPPPMIAPGYGANFVNQVQVIVNGGNAAVAKQTIVPPIIGKAGPAGAGPTRPPTV